MSDCKIFAGLEQGTSPRVGSGVDFKHHKVSPNINCDAHLSIRHRVYPQTSPASFAQEGRGFLCLFTHPEVGEEVRSGVSGPRGTLHHDH
jgi:hypothetical protein